MRYVLFYARSILLVAMTVLAGRWAAQRIGVWPALAAFAGFATAATLLGGYLLKTSELGKVTWKNRVAGYLIPWGWSLAGGKLGRAMAACGVIWMLLGSVGALLSSTPLPMPIASTSAGGPFVSNVLFALLVIAWLVDGGALLYFISVIAKNFSLRSSQAMSIFKVVGICLLVLGASFTAFLLGHPILALLIAGAPPVAVGGFFGLYVLIILMAGKNVRWN